MLLCLYIAKLAGQIKREVLTVHLHLGLLLFICPTAPTGAFRFCAELPRLQLDPQESLVGIGQRQCQIPFYHN